MTCPLFFGGFTNAPPIGMCGGVFVAVLFTIAAGRPSILTFELSPPSRMPVNGCGVGTGEVGPGGWMR